MNTRNAHWQTFASRWNRLGSPLRPCAEDVENFRQALGDAPGHCLLLGVTPELAKLAAHLTALDNSADMIGALWHGEQEAVLGDWLAMPFENASFDSVIGDGCPVLLSWPLQYEQLFAQVGRVLKPGGKFLLRTFVGAETAESAEKVCQDARDGKMKSFHAFKWRLSMAIAAASPAYTFRIADTVAAFDRLLPDRQQLAAASGWRREDIETIDFYRGSTACYSYPPLSQVRKTIPLEFKECEPFYGTYELAERCPLLSFKPR
ncbi:MAG: class I SAM-dependent methyltransferase [Sideroxyarcus sp.]|nr:class I SAM-dependent methyltransferase [Sideroxyarcus sp.]